MARYDIDFAYPKIPEAEATRFGRTVSASMLAGFAAVANHLMAWRARLAVHKVFDYSRDTTAAHLGNVERQDPDGVTAPRFVWWKTHPLCRAVFVAFRYQAHRGGKSTPLDIRVDATLRLKGASPASGAIIDAPGGGGAGVRWSAVNGALELRRWRQGYDALGAPVYRYPILVAHTGARPDLEPSGTLARPRPLIVDASDAGSWVELELDPLNVRLLTVDVWELPTPVVEL